MQVVERRARGVLPPVERTGRRRAGMGVLEMFRVAGQGLLVNRLRSLLTMLGVIIGVASVIVMVALGNGAAQATRDAIARVGTNRMWVRPEDQQVGGVRQGEGSGRSLRVEDAEYLLKGRWIRAVAPEYRNSATVRYRGENTKTTVVGSWPEYFETRNIPIAEGRAFTKQEDRQKARVAVLGWEVKEVLFPNDSPVGKWVRINGQSFRVIGLAERRGGTGWRNPDDQITIPLDTAMLRLFGADRIHGISVQAVSEERMLDAEEEVYRLMARAHRQKEGDPPDIRIHNQQDLVDTANEQSTFLTNLLSGIALVSLIVGGIGIMNIMLVTVTERTREIGIRKAIGAKRKDILYQFLIESIALSVIGGLIGVAVGIGVTFWMGTPADEGGLGYPMLLTPAPVAIAFGFSALVGVFFGLYPAVKASALDPIQALRVE